MRCINASQARNKDNKFNQGHVEYHTQKPYGEKKALKAIPNYPWNTTTATDVADRIKFK